MDRARPLRCSVPLLAAALVVAVGALVAPVFADEQVLTLDPQASDVSFLLPATGHDVHGTLVLRDGVVRFDPATGAASGRIAIDATRAETGNGSRDKTMHNKVLEVARYPLFVFVPERFEGELPAAGGGAAASEVKLVGTLSIHGSEHPLTLPAKVERDGDHLTATTTFQVPYVEWGMHNPSLLFLRVADEVAVTVAADGTLTTADGTRGRRRRRPPAPPTREAGAEARTRGLRLPQPRAAPALLEPAPSPRSAAPTASCCRCTRASSRACAVSSKTRWRTPAASTARRWRGACSAATASMPTSRAVRRSPSSTSTPPLCSSTTCRRWTTPRSGAATRARTGPGARRPRCSAPSLSSPAATSCCGARSAPCRSAAAARLGAGGETPGLDGILNGQALDLRFGERFGGGSGGGGGADGGTSGADVLRVAEGKTVSLIRLTLVLPALTAGAGEATLASLERLARAWGLAYQVLDDFKDCLMSHTETGKSSARDGELGRPNLPRVAGWQPALDRLESLLAEAGELVAALGTGGAAAWRPLVRLQAVMERELDDVRARLPRRACA